MVMLSIENEVDTPKLNTRKKSNSNPEFEALLTAIYSKDIFHFISILNSNKFLMKYQEPSRKHRTALIYAVKTDFIKGIHELLERGANPNQADDFGTTAIHFAARNTSLPSVEKLISMIDDINNSDHNGRTPLHFASQAVGNSKEEIFKVIQCFLDSGALVCSEDSEKKTPLHNAALVGNAELLSLFLKKGGTRLLNLRDNEGKTALHHAVIGGRSLNAVLTLLNSKAIIDTKDNRGYTPLHYCAGRQINYVNEEFDSDCLKTLLSHGASVTAKTNDDCNALHLALQNTMWWGRHTPRDTHLQLVQTLVANGSPLTDCFAMWRILETFPSLAPVALNQSIRANTSVKDSKYLRITLDIRPLTALSNLKYEIEKQKKFFSTSSNELAQIPSPLFGKNEVSMLHYILWSGHRNILLHPLCSTFLHLKWLKIRKYIIFNMLFHMIFMIILTGYMLTLDSSCDNPANETPDPVVDPVKQYPYGRIPIRFPKDSPVTIEVRSTTWLSLVFMTIFMIFRETFQIINSPFIYVKHYENYIDISIIASIIALLATWTGPCFTEVQRIFGSIAAITGWSRLMLFMGHLPSCGVYIVMFSNVGKTVVRFMVMYLPLIIAFALGFFILLEDISTFQDIYTSLVTTVVMMTGELEFKENILSSSTITTYQFFPILLLLLFILLVVIILSNLLVALAVNDMTSIQQRSELLRLTRQVELMIQAEAFVRSPFIPVWISRFLQEHISLSKGQTDRKITFHPNKRMSINEKIFISLSSVCSDNVLNKVFECFISGFIPPDPEPVLPKKLLKEATEIALLEHEIEKRNKFLMLRSKCNKQKSLKMFRQISVEALGTSLFHKEGNNDDNIPLHSRQSCNLKPTPSVRGSIWRENFRIMEEEQEMKKEKAQLTKSQIDALQKSVEDLQKIIAVLAPRSQEAPTPIRPEMLYSRQISKPESKKSSSSTQSRDLGRVCPTDSGKGKLNQSYLTDSSNSEDENDT